MLEEAQHFQLAKNALRWDQRLEHIWQLLQCHSSSIARICDGPGKYEKYWLWIQAMQQSSIKSKKSLPYFSIVTFQLAVVQIFLCFSLQLKLIFNFLFAAQVSHYKQTSMENSWAPQPWHKCHFILSPRQSTVKIRQTRRKQTNIRWSLKGSFNFLPWQCQSYFSSFVFQSSRTTPLGKMAFLYSSLRNGA